MQEETSHTKELTRRLEELCGLQQGWLNGRDGTPPNGDALAFAYRVIKSLLERGLPLARLYPTPDGEIQAEWAFGDWAVDVRLGPGGFTSGATNGRTSADDEGPAGDDTDALATWLSRKCSEPSPARESAFVTIVRAYSDKKDCMVIALRHIEAIWCVDPVRNESVVRFSSGEKETIESPTPTEWASILGVPLPVLLED